MTVVLGYGPLDAALMLIGEAPGREESRAGRPFVGRSGTEQAAYLKRCGVDPASVYMTNVVKRFIDGNPDPTPELIAEWTPALTAEIAQVRPKVIGAVGRFAMRWLLGDAAELSVCQGLAHQAGAFDVARVDRALSAPVVPVQHPASGFYDGDARALISRDYTSLARTLERVQQGKPVDYRRDAYAGLEDYRDVSGVELAALVDALPATASIGYDTEGIVGSEWSVQVAPYPGTAWVLRCARTDFTLGAASIQRAGDRGITFIAHNLMHDMPVSRAMGIELCRARIIDTMYQAFALKLEPQGLKALAWRWNGRKRQSYGETVGDAGTRKQVAYLAEVLTRRWGAVPPRVTVGNDGSIKAYRPQGAARRALSVLSDHADAMDSNDIEETVDLHARWRQVDHELRATVEHELGPMPVGTLDDLPLDEAVAYAAADADDEIRLAPRLAAALEAEGLSRVVERGMLSLPSFERIQATGMPVSLSRLQALGVDIQSRMLALQTRISTRYWDGESFNPASHVQVAALLKRRKLKGAKVTSTGKVSTGKGSIEHLRFTDEAVSDVIDWRELAKTLTFTDVERLDPAGPDIQPVHGQIKITRIPTRRLAMSEPNLLQIPTRHELGRQVRSCYRVPDGQLLGSWDLSGIEMRVAAHLADDELMCQLFNEGRDVHSETAARIFGIPVSDVNEKTQRYPAKRAAFGSLYGIGGEGLYTQLRQMPGCDGWDAKSCDKLIKEWFNVYKGIRREIDDTARRVRAYGYVADDLSGARRYLPGVWSDDKGIRGEAERQAFNHRVQGMAQTMLQEATIYLWQQLLPLETVMPGAWQWRLQQHDELVFSFTTEVWPFMDATVMDALVNHCGVTLRVPVKASGKAAQSWGELK